MRRAVLYLDHSLLDLVGVDHVPGKDLVVSRRRFVHGERLLDRSVYLCDLLDVFDKE